MTKAETTGRCVRSSAAEAGTKAQQSESIIAVNASAMFSKLMPETATATRQMTMKACLAILNRSVSAQRRLRLESGGRGQLHQAWDARVNPGRLHWQPTRSDTTASKALGSLTRLQPFPHTLHTWSSALERLSTSGTN
jgi:hypothetical protein